VKATGIEDDPEMLEYCKNDNNDSDDDDDVNVNHNDDDYEYPFVPGDYYDSDDENNRNKGANNNNKSARKINIYLLSQALGFTVKNKFITEKHLNKLMKIKENSKKSEK
jgi:hypothetical protein